MGNGAYSLNVVLGGGVTNGDIVTRIIYEGHSFTRDSLNGSLKALGTFISKIVIDEVNMTKTIYVERLFETAATDNRQLLID